MVLGDVTPALLPLSWAANANTKPPYVVHLRGFFVSLFSLFSMSAASRFGDPLLAPPLLLARPQGWTQQCCYILAITRASPLIRLLRHLVRFLVTRRSEMKHKASKKRNLPFFLASLNSIMFRCSS